MKLSRYLLCSILAFSFMPWLLVWIFTFMFVPVDGWSPLQQSLKFLGPIWIALSPVLTFYTTIVIIREYEIERKRG